MKFLVGYLSILLASAHAFSTPPFLTSQTIKIAPATTVLSASADADEQSNSINNNNAQRFRAMIATKTTASLVLGGAILLSSMGSLPDAALADSATLDFSLPSSYDTKMSGFGEGVEAYLSGQSMTNPGANEKEKQLASMRSAEQARQEAKARKQAERKALDEEANRRTLEKKARDAERLKNIWN